jgi:ferritin-like protein
MNILTNLVGDILDKNYTLTKILRVQQEYHEKRRWSVFEVIGDRHIENLYELECAALWHASRAELTTQPAGIRMAVQGVTLAEKIKSENPVGAMVLHAAAAWSARYWLEEEAHHEVAYGMLLEMTGTPPIEHDELVEHRGFFPDDNFARVCMLQTCVEIEACATYGYMAHSAKDPLVREIFQRIMRDESQHRKYFISFAKGLVDSGVYPVKDVLSMAYTWLRPNVGETHGSTREQQPERQGFVNWWERVRIDEESGLALTDEQIRSKSLQSRKEKSIFSAVSEATGIKVNSVKELQVAYFKSLTTPDCDRAQYSINQRSRKQASLAQ